MIEYNYIKLNYWIENEIKEYSIATKLLSIIGFREDELMPSTLFGGDFTRGKIIEYERSNFDILVECFIDSRVGYFSLSNKDKEKREFKYDFDMMEVKNKIHNYKVITFRITDTYFTCQDRIDKFITVSKDIARVVNPIYGLLHEISDNLDNKRCRYKDIKEGKPSCFWGNYFGQQYVKEKGREKLLSSPAYKVEELNNGGILILTTPSPLNPSSPDNRLAQDRLEEYLGFNK